nr:uncharacterized protein LOC111425460 [Onthophagus taurus]
MSSDPTKDECFPLAYITDMKKVYREAIEILKKSRIISVIPVNNPGDVMMSLVYMCTEKEVFLFDILRFGQNQLPKELYDIIMCDKIQKVVYTQTTTSAALGLDDTVSIPNVYDVEIYAVTLRQKMIDRVNYIRETYGIELMPENFELPMLEYLPMTTQPRLADVDWTVRPFQANEHFKIAQHFFQFISLFEQMKRSVGELAV